MADYTRSWMQQKQPVEFDGFATHGYMLYALAYTVQYWIHQNQAKPELGFWSCYVSNIVLNYIIFAMQTVLN